MGQKRTAERLAAAEKGVAAHGCGATKDTFQCFSIIVKRGNQKREVNVRRNMRVPELKDAVSEATRLPLPLVQHLIFAGQQLQDTLGVSDYNLCAGSVIEIGTGLPGCA